MSRARRGKTKRVCFYLEEQTINQLNELADALHVYPAAVVSTAIARHYVNEPALGNRPRKSTNGKAEGTTP